MVLFKQQAIFIDMLDALFLILQNHSKMLSNLPRIPYDGYVITNFLNGMKKLGYIVQHLLVRQLLAVL